MHVIWKRPDGYHGATPADFVVVDIGGESRIWLHKSDKNEYPFRISGGWEEEEQTKKFNNLVNLLGQDRTAWLDHLKVSYSHSIEDDRQTFFAKLVAWLEDLITHIKGDSWEVEILSQGIRATIAHLEQVKAAFLRAC